MFSGSGNASFLRMVYMSIEINRITFLLLRFSIDRKIVCAHYHVWFDFVI